MAIGHDLNRDVYRTKATHRSVTQSLEWVDVIVCNSNPLCRQVDKLTASRKRATCITRGTDVSRFRRLEADERCELRSRLGWQDQIIILNVGYLKRDKGIFGLVEAFDRNATVVPHLRLVFVGDGPERSRLTSRVNQSPFRDRIEMLGHVDHANMPGYYQAADIVALNSYAEGMPNAVVEGIACGRPILASNVGGIPDVAPHGKAGLLVDPHDIGAS